MSTQTVTKKRKSAGDSVSATKKVKTAKSVEKPGLLKSALKKTKDVPAKETKAKASKAPKSTPLAKQDVAREVDEVDISVTAKDAAEGGAELTEDQTAALIAGFTSSEDEASGDEEDGIAISKLPQAPRMKDIQKRIKDATSDDPERTPGVIYIGRIPHGFFEKQMRAYLSQFGEITQLRLARNKKTGKSQHYGFVEFSSKAVAEIVAKTMDKYLLFGHILQVRTIPMEQVKEGMWKGSGRRKKPAPRNRLEGSKLKRGMAREDWDKRVERETKKRAEKADKLKDMGYEFDMPALKAASEVPTKSQQTEDFPAGGDAGESGVKLLAATEGAVEPAVAGGAVEDATNLEAVVEKTNKKRPAKEAKTKKAKKVKT